MTRLRLLVAITLLTPVALHAQHAEHAPGAKGKVAKPAMSEAQKLASAMSAAPPEVAKNATIMDWPAAPGGQPKQLRAGTNGWVCYPSSPEMFEGAAIDDPMCLDKEWQGWAGAWMSKGQPKVSGTGIAYMLRGDKGASNTDPFATGPAAGNNWVVSPPHIMVLFADLKVLDAYPTDPKSGGPWVMWKGTPYAHLMVPVSPTRTATMTAAK